MGFKKPNTAVAQYVDRPGWFHCVVTSIEENPVVDGAVKDQVNIGLAVLGGTDPSQVKKQIMLRLQNPNDGHKDGGEFAAKVQCRMVRATDIFAIATNTQGERQYFKIDDVPDDSEIELDWLGSEHRENPNDVSPWIIGKQLVVKLHEEEYQGKKNIKLDGANIYHVTDEEVRDIPKDAAALKAGGYKVQAPAPKTEAPPAGAAKGATTPEKPAANPGSSTKASGGASKPTAAPPAKNGAKPVAAGAYDDL